MSPGTDFRIVIIQNRNLSGRLIDENIPFTTGIFLHGFMALHVVRRKVQDCRHIRAEIFDAFQLVTGYFRCYPAVLIQPFYFSGKSPADIAAHRRLYRKRLQHFADKSRCGGFSVGSGDGHHVSGIIAPGQFDFADDLHAVFTGFLQLRKIPGHRRR